MIDIASKIRKLSLALQSSQNELGRNINLIREKLSCKQAERESILRSPLPRNAARERLEGAVNAAEGLSGVEDFVHKITTGAPIDFLGGHNNQQWLAYLLAHVARPLLIERLEQFYEGSNGLTSEEREERLASLDAEILDLERQDESCVRAAEAAGGRITRRPEARPEILLLPDGDLP